jgi:hypothetical protein
VNDLECISSRRGERRAFDTNAGTTFVEQTLDVFQAELDSEALKAVKPDQRFTVIDRLASRRANPRGIARPSRSALAGSIHGATVK